jgi:hypothetical protein
MSSTTRRHSQPAGRCHRMGIGTTGAILASAMPSTIFTAGIGHHSPSAVASRPVPGRTCRTKLAVAAATFLQRRWTFPLLFRCKSSRRETTVPVGKDNKPVAASDADTTATPLANARSRRRSIPYLALGTPHCCDDSDWVIKRPVPLE